MYVVATAGHVDHGKSTLVRSLTGIEPDRWQEERRRGLTIDLGYAWTTLPSGQTVAFVDVPGHRRFIGNMLAGLGPAPAVVFVVAADEGWRAQSAEHLAAVDALGLAHGLLVVTRADLAGPERTAQTLADAGARIARSTLGEVPAVACSAVTGAGMDDLRQALSALVDGLPTPDPGGRVRLWVDRSFTVRGAGTVVTGTLGDGTIAVGDELELTGAGAPRRWRVRGLQSLEQARDEVFGTARVAINLRGAEHGDVGRGDALLTPGAWRGSTMVDVRLTRPAAELPERLTLHVGTAAIPARVRPLAGQAARLALTRALPLTAGDRALLRDPGSAARLDDPSAAITGVVIVDIDPPDLHRRGAGAARGEAVAHAHGSPDLAAEVARRGHLAVADAQLLGIPEPGDLPHGVVRVADRYVSDDQFQAWSAGLTEAVRRHAAASPLEPRLPAEAARAAVGLPDLRLVAPLASATGLIHEEGRLAEPGAGVDLGPAEAGLRRWEERLAADPFVAPEAEDLASAGLGPRQLAAAARSGRVLRLPGDVVLLPTAPARAMRVLAALPQPFTLSEARRALRTTRRVAVPLLEHLDGRGWTRRVDGQRREVVR